MPDPGDSFALKGEQNRAVLDCTSKPRRNRTLVVEHPEHLRETNDLFADVAKSQSAGERFATLRARSNCNESQPALYTAHVGTH
jgi:hypothetical protein